ncbi:MAG: thiolase family protein [Chloroflexota bacterium]|nr:thiolase family protein [Chloroflexota bacterium]
MPELREVVVVDAVRAPTGRAGWGGKKQGIFHDVSAQTMLAQVMAELIRRVQAKAPAFDVGDIEDIAVGCGNQIGEQARIGWLVRIALGLPAEVAGWTMERACPASLQAINAQAQAIMCGHGDVMIAGGVEMMSRYPLGSNLDAAVKAGIPVLSDPRVAERGFVLMGVAAEMVAERYDLSREAMDRFGLWSQQKAVQAVRDREWYQRRVVPITVERDGQAVVVERDEGLREEAVDDPEAAWERMSRLEPRFKENGLVTAGSSSGIVDGAAAVMLMSREKADELGLEPMVRVRSVAVGACDPVIMLLGPIPAMRKALARGGLTMSDMDVIETNEAFASPVLAQCLEFGLAFDDPRINPTGGAIAIGHPIGGSGALYFTEMVHHMVRHDLRYGIQTLCGGGGQAAATIVERVAWS